MIYWIGYFTGTGTGLFWGWMLFKRDAKQMKEDRKTIDRLYVESMEVLDEVRRLRGMSP
jgi:hypothetical protein